MRTPQLSERDLAVLRRAFLRFPWLEEVRLFGSRATGNARRATDIDLAISAPRATLGEWLEFKEALDSAPIIYELDLVRMEVTSNPRLLGKIAADGISIYRAGAAPVGSPQLTGSGDHP